MRKLLSIFFLVFYMSYGQKKQVLYDFAGLPQTLLLNPGAEVNLQFHAGLPLMSKLSFQAGFTAFSVYDIFADDGRNINDKLDEAFDTYGKTEFVAIHQQIELLSGGFQLPNKSYLSFGFYQELDVLAKAPKDMVDLYYSGNTTINRNYSVRKTGVRAELLGVLHLGLSKKINEKWQIGGRAKIYSSVFNAYSKGNKGALYTEPGTSNIYSQYLDNVNVKLQTSGLIFETIDEDYSSYIKKNLLFGGSLGVGFDLGFTHHLKDQWIVTGSLQDIGFISNSKDIKSYEIIGDYELEGLELNFDPKDPSQYWSDLKNEFNESIELTESDKNYISFRPVKVNGSIKYSFGEKRFNDCNYINNTQSYLNNVGFHLYANLSGVHSYMASTLFYERKLSSNFHGKITYTADSFSFTNVGLGLSSQFGIVNLYLLADNLLHLNNIYEAKNASFQIGINFMFNNK